MASRVGLWIVIAWTALGGAFPIGAAEPALAWPQWRGPTGQGHSEDQRVPLSWNERENLVWKTALPGAGNSSPIVVGERIFLTAAGPDGDERYVVCVRTGDGRLLWQDTACRDVPRARSHAWNGYASASCATDGERVYAFFGAAGLFCYDLSGKQLWKHAFGIFGDQSGWGTAASPIVVDDLVIQNCDNDNPIGLPAGTSPDRAAPAALVGLDKLSGKIVWSTPRNQGRGFTTPVLLPMAGGRVDLVLNGPRGIWGYDPHTGSERWHCERTSTNDSHRFGEPLPVSDGEMLYIASGRPGPCQGLRLPGDGDVTRTHMVWQSNRKGHRDVSSPIQYGGYIYAADHRGMLSCIELKTGKEIYTVRLGNGANKPTASPVAVRGKLLYLLDDGTTVVVEPGPKFKEAGRNRLGEGKALDFMASPAIADGQLFLRSQSHLYCISAR